MRFNGPQRIKPPHKCEMIRTLQVSLFQGLAFCIKVPKALLLYCGARMQSLDNRLQNSEDWAPKEAMCFHLGWPEMTHWENQWPWRLQSENLVQTLLLTNVTNSVDMSLSKLQRMVMEREAWHAAIHGVTKSWAWLTNWTTCDLVRALLLLGFNLPIYKVWAIISLIL